MGDYTESGWLADDVYKTKGVVSCRLEDIDGRFASCVTLNV